MCALRSLQESALDAFLDGKHVPFIGEILDGALPASVRIAVYENNLRENYRKCLANAYPVVHRLVGEDCFRGLAARYTRTNRSTNGDLQFFGAGLARLLDETYRDTAFAYLADVARLEWAIEQALIVPQSESMDLSRIARVDPSLYPGLRFSLRSGFSLIESAFPVLSIWRANQKVEPDPVDLASGGEIVAVLREADGAELRRLDKNAAALAKCFAAGLSLGEASASLESLRGFDLAASLQTLFLNHCLAECEAGPGAVL